MTRADNTFHMLGQIQYTKLGTRHVQFVQEEMNAQGGTYPPKDGIRKLGKILLALELIIQKIRIRETTGNKQPDDSMLNMKTYLPMYWLEVEYEIN